jgi:hypothetical protein
LADSASSGSDNSPRNLCRDASCSFHHPQPVTSLDPVGRAHRIVFSHHRKDAIDGGLGVAPMSRLDVIAQDRSICWITFAKISASRIASTRFSGPRCRPGRFSRLLGLPGLGRAFTADREQWC